MDIDVLVIGAGVVGLSVARNAQLGGQETVLVEREMQWGMHTSSRNSEVIHAGIYYSTNSVKAELCVRGNQLLYEYCASKRVTCCRIGKLIVANDGEVEALEAIRDRAIANGVENLRLLAASEIVVMEPEITAKTALFSPGTGIVDSHGFMQALLTDFEAAGGIFARRCAVDSVIVESTGFIVLLADGERLRARAVINCAGLEAPVLAEKIKGLPQQYIPARRFAIGHYYTLRHGQPFKHLVYPIPEPGGLGVHVTLDLAGGVRFGPDVRWIDSINYSFEDTRRAEFVASISRYYPRIDAENLVPAYTGIRPKIVIDGNLHEDFVISGPAQHGIPNLVNLFGIESPGLTASLAIAAMVRDRLGHVMQASGE